MENVRIPWKGWVLVCDGAKALLFRNDGDADLLNLTVVEAFGQPDEAAQALGTDRPGRVHQSYGTARSAVEEVDRHEEAEAAFLASIAKALEKAVREKTVGRLVIVAAPRALGLLRKHLTPDVQAIVTAEVPKDLTRLSTPEIEKHLAA